MGDSPDLSLSGVVERPTASLAIAPTLAPGGSNYLSVLLRRPDRHIVC